MKKMNKKGFTIVELVIVIAVIAILAAVLIPTFSGVVKKANKSAALQEARNAMTNDLVEADADYANMLIYEVGGKQYYAGKVETGQQYYHAATTGEPTTPAAVNATADGGIAVIAFEGFYDDDNGVYTVETSKGYTCSFTVETGVWAIEE